MLMSDLHIGSANCREEIIRRDLEQAEALDADIHINGDVFDAILPSDKKRYNPTALASWAQGRANVVDAAIDRAMGLLGPFAGRIRMIGVGNHETAVEKHHGSDPVALLVNFMNREHGTAIEYGGYCGWLLYRFRTEGEGLGGQWRRFSIHYHHGSGGASPITKGLIQHSRKTTWVEGADVIWMGHTHHRNVDTSVAQFVNRAGHLEHRRRLHVTTGSYLTTYEQQSGKDALANGRKASYASDWGVAPQDKGGILLSVTFRRDGLEMKATV